MNVFIFLLFWCCASLGNAWFIMKTMEYLIVVSKKCSLRLLMLTACFILVKSVIFMGDPVNILGMTAFFLFAVWMSCEGSFWKKTAVGLLYITVFFAFNAIRDNYIIYDIRMFSRPLFTYSLTTVCSFLFAVLFYIGIRKYAPDVDYELSDNMWKLLILLMATPFSIVFSIVILFHKRELGNNWTNSYEYAVILLIAFLSFISLFWCVLVLAKQQKLERQSMLMEMNSKYYEFLEEQHFEIRRFRHDFANHIQVLSTLLPERRDEYIKNLAKDSSIVQPVAYCGDATVNAVLSVKKSMMEHHGICMEIAVDIPKELPFEKTDICALYANALDNAMEACIGVLEEERVVMLKSRAQKGLFCLEVRNPAVLAGRNQESYFVLSTESESGHMPATSKMDKINHGLGLKSIREIVGRYGGRMEGKTGNGIFELFLYLPFPAK